MRDREVKRIPIASTMDAVLHRRLKTFASKSGLKLNAVLDEAVRAYLKSGGKEKPQNGQ